MGRERASSVFDCTGSLDSLEKCHNKIINFNKKKTKLKASPYYKKNPIDSTLKIIKKLRIPTNSLKKFYNHEH